MIFPYIAYLAVILATVVVSACFCLYLPGLLNRDHRSVLQTRIMYLAVVVSSIALWKPIHCKFMVEVTKSGLLTLNKGPTF